MGNWHNSSSQQSSANDLDTKSIYRDLISMGFDQALVNEAIDNKCKNLNECIDYITLKTSTTEPQENDAIEEKKINVETHRKDNVMDRYVTYMPTFHFSLYEFGVIFNYWQEKSPQYITKNHKNLRDEMLNNTNGRGNSDGDGQFRITEEKWNKFMKKAGEKYQIMYGYSKYIQVKPLYAKDKGHLNKVFNIKPGSKLTIEHIMSILLYTDTEDLQNCLKKQCRKINMLNCICNKQLHKMRVYENTKEYTNGMRCYDCKEAINDNNESIYHCDDMKNEEHKNAYDLCIKCAHKKMISEIANRNAEYHNWLRLLSEVVYLFGDELLPNQSVYHGISAKLLFDSFDVHFKTPLSTTTSTAVAQRFAFGGGIILELVNGGAHNEPCLSVDFFSEYSERELLFFGCHLKVKSIIVDGEEETIHYKKEIKLLNIYMNILNGWILNKFDLKDVLKECKDDLLIFIDTHINLLKTGNANKNGAQYDEYIFQLFLNCTAPHKKIWINANQIRYLQNIDANISKKFIVFDDDFDNNSRCKFGEYLSLLQRASSLKLNISVIAQYKWIITNKDLKHLLNGKVGRKGLLSNDYWPVSMDNDGSKLCHFKGNMVMNPIKKRNDNKIGFCIVLEKMPKIYESIRVSYQLYCKQINFNYIFPENIMSTRSDGNYGFSNVGVEDLFNASKLNNLKTFEWEIVVKCYL
eukprot:515699_1